MKKAYFPMFIDISEKKILIVGGGKIADRRVTTLLMFTERITVLAPQICAELEVRKQEGSIKCLYKEWEAADLEGYDIVLAATNNSGVNSRIRILCNEKNIAVNVADDKNACDFFFPGVIKNEDIVIGISTGGEDPGKAKEIRKKLTQIINNE